MKERILDLIFPRNCPVCGDVVRGNEKYICDECRKEVLYISEPKCQKCGKSLNENGLLCKDCKEHSHEYEKGACVFEYAGPIKESMYRFKYKNAREYAMFYGMEASRKYINLFKQWKIDGIVSVPVYKTKEIERGYNQADEFAKAVSQFSNIPIISKCLERTRNTTPQKELVGIKRKTNLENAFAIYKNKIIGYENVLLIDDIYTTGSTIDACSKLLKAAGVKKVYFLCISTGNL